MFVKDLDTVQGKCFSSETGSERRRLKEDEMMRWKRFCISLNSGQRERLVEKLSSFRTT